MDSRTALICILACLLPAHILAVPSRGVTHEDIRDAIISFVHMFRDLTDKLERHELRERTLGDQLKRALSGLDKRERAQDSRLDEIFNTVRSIDQRLAKMEESAGEGLKEKDVYSVDTDNLQTWMANLEGKLTHQDQNKDLERVVRNLDTLPAKYDTLEREIRNLEQTVATMKQNADDRSLEMTTTIVNATEQAKNEILDNQNTNKLAYLRAIEAHSAVLSTGQRQFQLALDESTRMADKFHAAVMGSYTQLAAEIKSLPKVEQVLIQTADNVMDTKRRVEYGVHQILLEVGDLVKSLGKDLNTTVNTRFNDISANILANQKEGLTNLSSKVETEISQVWRQIGIMYKQLSASAGTLDSLQKQTETYVNGSLSTMDGMENKVTLITGRMNEVDENLNYLLGRLSLVTQEFNLTKNALGVALDNIRSSFKEVKEKVEQNPGPGPNMISEESADNINTNNV